jgi:hypothetical protein
MKNEKFETHQCFIWILMKNMSITEVFVSTPPLSGNGIRRGLVIVKARFPDKFYFISSF